MTAFDDRAEAAAYALLVQQGASFIKHPGGNLLDHLVRTSSRLRSWGMRTPVVLAGLAHAAYGTDGFAAALLDPFSERERARAVLGSEAEELVYLYAACDRRATYQQFASSGPITLRDRFAGRDVPTVARLADELAALTVANEVDLIIISAEFAATQGTSVISEFSTWLHRLPLQARADFAAAAVAVALSVQRTADPG